MSNISAVGAASVPSQTVLNNPPLHSGVRLMAKVSLVTLATFLILAAVVFIREYVRLKNLTLTPQQLDHSQPLSPQQRETWLQTANQYLWPTAIPPLPAEGFDEMRSAWQEKWIPTRNAYSRYGFTESFEPGSRVDASLIANHEIQTRLNSTDFQANPQLYFDQWDTTHIYTNTPEYHAHEFFREGLGFSKSTAAQEAIDDQRLAREGGFGSIRANIRILARNVMGAFNDQTQLRPSSPTIH